MRGFKSLKVGMKVPVTLIGTDSVHGFIDFEFRPAGASSKSDERRQRKRVAARALMDRIGERFNAEVAAVTGTATWIKVTPGDIEGRLVRGRGGLKAGDRVGVVLLSADPDRGFIDFARDSAVIPI